MFRKLRWILRGRPKISYPGYNCGLCGAWVDKPFEVIDYNLRESTIYVLGDSIDIEAFGHTWGICQKCIGEGFDDGKKKQIVKNGRQLGNG